MNFEVSYRFPADRLFSGLSGDFDLRALASHTQSIRQDNGTGAPPTESAGYRSNPKWRDLSKDIHR